MEYKTTYDSSSREDVSPARFRFWNPMLTQERRKSVGDGTREFLKGKYGLRHVGSSALPRMGILPAEWILD